MSAKYFVGQKLWFQSSSRHRASGEVTVAKVGRRWVQLDNGLRFDIGTGVVDGGDYSSPGKIWITYEEWERYRNLMSEWGDLRRALERCWSLPPGVTLDDIAKARELLRLT